MIISSWVAESAVAVKAIKVVWSNRSLALPNLVYSGLKSCPQVETQCASSIAMIAGGFFFRKWNKSGCRNFSGET